MCKSYLQQILGVQVVNDLGIYLGLPSYFSRRKKDAFSAVKERVWKVIQGWKGHIFSASGKEILIKSIAQAIPAYAMSCFRLPKSFCRDVEWMISRFWWGSTIDKNRLHWKSWDKMCRPKEAGGLNFRDLENLTKSC